MGANDTVVGIGWQVKLDQLREQMAQVPGITDKQAKLATAALDKQMKAAEKAAKDAAKNTKGAWGSSLKSLGDGADAAGRSSTKLRGILSALSPELGAYAGGANDAADALEVVAGGGPAVVAVTAAIAEIVGIGYLAWRSYTEEETRAAKIAGEVEAAHRALKPILDSTRDATIDLMVATGELSEEEGKLEHNSIRAYAALQQTTEGTRKKLSALQVEQASVTTQMVDMAESIIPAWTPLGYLLDGVTTNTAEYQQELDGLHKTLDQANEETRKNVQVTGGLIKSQEAAKRNVKAHAAAEHDLTKELLDQAHAAQEANDRFEAKLQAVEESAAAADAIVAGSTAVELDLADQLARKRDADIDAYVEKARAGAKTVEEIEAGKTAIILGYSRQITDAEDEASRKAIEATRARMEAAVDSITAGIESISGAASDAYAADAERLTQALDEQGDSLTASQKEHMKARIAADKRHALEAFRIEQGAAAVQVGINTVRAASEAAASAPWPLNLALVAGATALGVGQEIAIANQSPPAFHSGMAPDEYAATLTKQEGVLSGQGVAAAGGPQAVRDLNAGRSTGQLIKIQYVLGHRIFNEAVYQNARSGGYLSTLAPAKSWHRSTP